MIVSPGFKPTKNPIIPIKSELKILSAKTLSAIKWYYKQNSLSSKEMSLLCTN